MTLSKQFRFFLVALFVVGAFVCFASAVQAVTAPPTITPGGSATYAVKQSVNMTAGAGAQIYYTLDGSTPTTASTLYTAEVLLYSSTVVKAIAVLSGVSSTVTVSNIVIDYNAATVLGPYPPQWWYRSDFGITSSAGAVSQWLDVSGNSNVATQTNSSNQPTLVSDAINGLPCVNFNGSTQYLQFPSQFIYWPEGATMFVVTKPASATATGQFISTGAGTLTNSLAFGQNSGDTSFSVYYRTTGSSVSNTTAVSLQYQLVEILYDGVSTGTLFNNGNQTAQSTALSYGPDITCTNNYLGQSTAGGSFYSGQIAEMIIYRAPITISQRTAIESYLQQKYQFTLQSPPAPIISVATSTLAGPSEIAIAGQNGAAIYYTTDGTTPTTSSTLYTGPVSVYYTQTLKAIAVTNGNSSSISSATYTLNSTQWPAPNSGDMTPLQIQLQIPTNSVPQ